MTSLEKTKLQELISLNRHCIMLCDELYGITVNPEIKLICRETINELTLENSYMNMIIKSCMDVSANALHTLKATFPDTIIDFYFKYDLESIDRCVQEAVDYAIGTIMTKLSTKNEVVFLRDMILAYNKIVKLCKATLPECKSQPIIEIFHVVSKKRSQEIITCKHMLENILSFTYKSSLLEDKSQPSNMTYYT